MIFILLESTLKSSKKKSQIQVIFDFNLHSIRVNDIENWVNKASQLILAYRLLAHLLLSAQVFKEVCD